MARTRTWVTTIPVDHTQIKSGPTKIRDLRTDIEERVDGILAGFVNTGTTNGLLLGRLLTVGTANSSNPGTGSAAAIDIYGMTTGTMTELFCRNSSGNEVQLTYQGKLLCGQLLNDKYLIGIGTTSGSVNILKVNTAGITQITNPVVFDSFPLAPSTNATTDLQLMAFGQIRHMFDTDVFVIQTAGAVVIDIKTASISSTYVTSLFGAWDSASFTTGTSYQAETDGIVCAICAANVTMVGYTDANNPPTTEVTRMNGVSSSKAGITMPVRKSDYWKIVTTGGGTDSVRWLPIGI